MKAYKILSLRSPSIPVFSSESVKMNGASLEVTPNIKLWGGFDDPGIIDRRPIGCKYDKWCEEEFSDSMRIEGSAGINRPSIMGPKVTRKESSIPKLTLFNSSIDLLRRHSSKSCCCWCWWWGDDDEDEDWDDMDDDWVWWWSWEDVGDEDVIDDSQFTALERLWVKKSDSVAIVVGDRADPLIKITRENKPVVMVVDAQIMMKQTCHVPGVVYSSYCHVLMSSRCRWRI